MSYELYEGKMAEIFDKMYQKFINYEEEFLFYHNLLAKYNCQSVFEIGSGTGILASKFTAHSNIDYQGLDYSLDMIKIAKERNPHSTFFHDDMRFFKLNSKVDAVIMTGRTSSYIITNSDLYNTLESVNTNLNNKGYFIFDFIDASRYIPYILKHKNIEHAATINNDTYSRIGNWFPKYDENFLLQWKAEYYCESSNSSKKLLKKDTSIVRVFTLDEFKLHLTLKGFNILEIIDRKTYAYDTYVIVAQK